MMSASRRWMGQIDKNGQFRTQYMLNAIYCTWLTQTIMSLKVFRVRRRQFLVFDLWNFCIMVSAAAIETWHIYWFQQWDATTHRAINIAVLFFLWLVAGIYFCLIIMGMYLRHRNPANGSSNRSNSAVQQNNSNSFEHGDSRKKHASGKSSSKEGRTA